MSDQAIFRSVGQALHVSFLLEILPPTQRVSTQVLIDGLKKRCGVWDEQRHAAHSVNFGGMTPLEVRGQCAMVRAAVADHLPDPERFAVHARFGHQITKAEGVRGLASYAAPLCGVQSDLAILAVTWSLFQPGRRTDHYFSLRAIERETGVSHSTLGRTRQRVMSLSQGLERRADDRLWPLFVRTGLVEN